MRVSNTTMAMLAIASAVGFGASVLLSEIYLSVGDGLLDGRLAGYDTASVNQYLGLLPAEGLTFYIGSFRVLDTIVPPVLALTFIGLIWTLGKTFWRAAIIFPLVYAFADLRENALVGQILNAGIGGSEDELVNNASDMTQLKWLFLVLSLGVVLWLWRKGRTTL